MWYVCVFVCVCDNSFRGVVQTVVSPGEPVQGGREGEG